MINKSSINKLAWEETGKIHLRKAHKSWLNKYKKPSFSSLNKIQKKYLKKIGVKNKKVAHLACNNGRELISIKRMGAKECIGFDFSKEFIAQAEELSKTAKSKCEFVNSDISKVSDKYNSHFDLVVITTGTLVWLNDLKKLFKTITRILKPGGTILINEFHPFLLMLDPSKKDNSLKIKNSYFRKKEVLDYGSMAYLGKEYAKVGKHYIYPYTISKLFNSLISNNFKIEEFSELDKDNSNSYKKYEKNEINFPMSYFLIAKKL